MKRIAIAIIVVIGLTALGWLSFDFSGKNPSFEIESETITDHTEAVIDTGREVLHETGETLKEITEE